MLALLFFSCNEKPKLLKPVSSRIEGPLAGCFEVVDRDYRIIGNQVNIEFARVNDCLIEPQIIAEFLDDVGNVVATSKVDLNGDQGMKFLFANKVGESSTVAFTISNGNPTKVRLSSMIPSEENVRPGLTLEDERAPIDIDTGMEEAESPIVMEEEELEDVEVEEEEENEDEEVEEDDQQEPPTQSIPSIQFPNGSRDWDKILDDLESYVDQYIILLKKANSGDMSALMEYASILEKAEKLEYELNNAKNDLSGAQMQRYVKIMTKMTEAAMSM